MRQHSPRRILTASSLSPRVPQPCGSTHAAGIAKLRRNDGRLEGVRENAMGDENRHTLKERVDVDHKCQRVGEALMGAVSDGQRGGGWTSECGSCVCLRPGGAVPRLSTHPPKRDHNSTRQTHAPHKTRKQKPNNASRSKGSGIKGDINGYMKANCSPKPTISKPTILLPTAADLIQPIMNPMRRSLARLRC